MYCKCFSVFHKQITELTLIQNNKAYNFKASVNFSYILVNGDF